MLTGDEIRKRLGNDIIIEPFCEEQLNPNSYNMKLGDVLAVYTDSILDVREKNSVKNITIPEEGFVLQPGELYLAKTYEYTETYNLVPIIFGRSSTGRIGITVHVTSGFGDIGFKGNWTLQLTCVKPVRIYPHMKICQVAYFETTGDSILRYHSKYQNSNEIEASKFYEEIN